MGTKKIIGVLFGIMIILYLTIQEEKNTNERLYRTKKSYK